MANLSVGSCGLENGIELDEHDEYSTGRKRNLQEGLRDFLTLVGENPDGFQFELIHVEIVGSEIEQNVA